MATKTKEIGKPSEDKKDQALAEAIKQIRCKSLLSQEAFAKMLGVSFTTVNRWETGKSKPSFKTLRIIDEYCKSKNIDFNADAYSSR